MAKKKKRRKSAGPPPAARQAQERAEEREKQKVRTAHPRVPSFRGVLIRAVLVAVLFYPYLLFIAKESTQTSAVISGIAFLAMIPLGMLLDRWRYRIQMRRFRRDHPGSE